MAVLSAARRTAAPDTATTSSAAPSAPDLTPHSGRLSRAALQAHAPDSVASDPFTICVHNGNDGTCGTTAPTAPKSEPPIVKPPVLVVLPDVPSVGGVKNGARYRHGRGPRVLKGAVQVPAGGTLRDVRISLQRRHGRHCQVFNGTRAVFVRARCGVARFFSVGGSESFSYLLSKALPAGRYVYEVEAVNDAGTKTVPVSGVSSVAFYVK